MTTIGAFTFQNPCNQAELQQVSKLATVSTTVLSKIHFFVETSMQNTFTPSVLT